MYFLSPIPMSALQILKPSCSFAMIIDCMPSSMLRNRLSYVEGGYDVLMEEVSEGATPCDSVAPACAEGVF